MYHMLMRTVWMGGGGARAVERLSVPLAEVHYAVEVQKTLGISPGRYLLCGYGVSPSGATTPSKSRPSPHARG
jgi:hypothetical protein